jgi:DNA-binding MurR/RpiR family transcriptional regulator
MTEAETRQADKAVTARNHVEALRARIVARYDSLSPRLKQVAAYALEHPNDLGLETLAVIARRCKVQPSTIVRFAKTFGYDGASDMQKLFRDELLSLAPSPSYAERIRQFSERAGETASQSPSALMHEFVEGNIAALRHLDQSTRQADLERGIALIAEAKAVYLVGLRRSFPVAAYLAYALRHADKRTYLVDGLAGMIAEQSSMMGPGDLLIATSFRTYAQQTVDIVNEAADRKVTVIAISDSRLSPIARRADLCFEVKDAEFRKFRSLTASLCLAQTLVIGYAYQLTERDAGRRPA